MSQSWTPLADYHNYHHVLGASACFVHPLNGNVYYWACEQQQGVHQNLTIYREMGTTLEWQMIVTFKGTVDAQTFIDRGGCVIGQGGALLVATSLQPIGVPYVTETGFQGVRCRIPGIDQPWSMGLLTSRVDALDGRVTALEQTSGGLSPEDRAALDTLKAMLAVACL